MLGEVKLEVKPPLQLGRARHPDPQRTWMISSLIRMIQVVFVLLSGEIMSESAFIVYEQYE